MASAIVELSESALKKHETLQYPPPKPGKPRLDPRKALLSDFYEPLVLLETLQRTLGCLKSTPATFSDAAVQAHPWRTFLNQLAWLCDYRNGGNSTSMIAVEAIPGGSKFWLALNFDRRQKGLSHLNAVLTKLASLDLSRPQTHRASLNEILHESLVFSSKKFENYRGMLLRDIEFAKKFSLDQQDSPEFRLLSDLGSISAEQEQIDLCTFAFGYIKADVLREVYRKHRGKTPRDTGSVWCRICHIIGRLGSWARAVRVLVRYVREQPQVLENFQVGFLQAPEAEIRPFGDHKTNLQGVLTRVLPHDEGRALRALELLRNTMALSGLNIEDKFKEKAHSKTFRPRVHAEILLLEHFWTKELAFFYNDLYVGSSKPSCYCCNLYFNFHSGDIVTRPTHGNVWSKWCLPPGAIQENHKLHWDTKIIVKRMIERVRHDLLQLIETDLPRQARLQDSTSGMWTAPTLGVPVVWIDESQI